MARRKQPNPAAYAAQVARDLAAAESQDKTRIYKLLTTLLTGSGWERRTRTNMPRIEEALSRNGVYTDADITNLELQRDSWIFFASTPFVKRELGHIFGYRRGLKWHVAHYPEDVFRGIPGLEALTLHGSEMHIEYGGELRKIELVFRDADGTYVAVELERGDPKDNSVAHLETYMKALTAGGYTPVRGLLITARPRGAQLEAVVAENAAAQRSLLGAVALVRRKSQPAADRVT